MSGKRLHEAFDLQRIMKNLDSSQWSMKRTKETPPMKSAITI